METLGLWDGYILSLKYHKKIMNHVLHRTFSIPVHCSTSFPMSSSKEVPPGYDSSVVDETYCSRWAFLEPTVHKISVGKLHGYNVWSLKFDKSGQTIRKSTMPCANRLIRLFFRGYRLSPMTSAITGCPPMSMMRAIMDIGASIFKLFCTILEQPGFIKLSYDT